jgi:hypothetical protein
LFAEFEAGNKRHIEGTHPQAAEVLGREEDEEECDDSVPVVQDPEGLLPVLYIFFFRKARSHTQSKRV